MTSSVRPRAWRKMPISNLGCRPFPIDPPASRAYPIRASRPDGRRASRAEESPGSTETRRRITSGGGDPRESATESKPPRVSRGKGERVR